MRPFTLRTQRVAPVARRHRPEPSRVVADEEAVARDRRARGDLGAEASTPADAVRCAGRAPRAARPTRRSSRRRRARPGTTRSASRRRSSSARRRRSGRARRRVRPSSGRRARCPKIAGEDAISPCGVACRQSTCPLCIEIACTVPPRLPMYATPSSTTAGNSSSPPSGTAQIVLKGGRSADVHLRLRAGRRRAVHRPLQVRPVDPHRHPAEPRERLVHRPAGEALRAHGDVQVAAVRHADRRPHRARSCARCGTRDARGAAHAEAAVAVDDRD